VDDRRAGKQRDDAAERQEGAERHPGLASALDAQARHHSRTDERAGNDRDKDRDSHLAPEEQAEDAGELDVAHPHAARIREHEHEQESCGPRAGDQLLWNAGRLQRQPDRDGQDRGRSGDLVRDDLVIEIDQRDRDEDPDEHQPQDLVDGRMLDEDHGDRERGGECLDRRVARRDRLATRAAAPAQQQPAEHRHVVVELDRRVAPGALGAGSDERLAARKPVGDDVEEGADHGSEECGQCDGHGFALRDGEDVMYEISTGGKRS